MSKLDSHKAYKTKSQHGATSVEFSVIAALLLIILFGIIEYSFLFLQEHYVANAAREAVRIGVRANNYSGYNGIVLPTASVYNSASDRETIVKAAAAEYLNIFYDETDVRNGTTLRMVDTNVGTDSGKILRVTVTVDNLMTNITPGLLRLLDPDSDTTNPSSITASAQMELEDQKEFDSDRGTEY